MNSRMLCLFVGAWLFAGVALAAQGSESSVPRMPVEQFLKLLKSDSVVVVDVRSKESYLAGHIPGAISIPLESIASQAGELKKAKKPIVAYCS